MIVMILVIVSTMGFVWVVMLVIVAMGLGRSLGA